MILLPPYLPHPTPKINTVEGSDAEGGTQQEGGVGEGEGRGGGNGSLLLTGSVSSPGAGTVSEMCIFF